MDHFITIWAIVVYVESHITENIANTALEEATGFCAAHLRDVFKARTGRTLARYILERKAANAAFDLLHARQSVLDTAMKYGFASHDAFGRAFRRVTGVTPMDCKRGHLPLGRIKLCAGVYGVGILQPHERMN